MIFDTMAIYSNFFVKIGIGIGFGIGIGIGVSVGIGIGIGSWQFGQGLRINMKHDLEQWHGLGEVGQGYTRVNALRGRERERGSPGTGL